MKHKAIDGKDVYIAQDHHHLLEAWATVRTALGKEPVLLSLDHHTDTKDAFHNHFYDPTTKNYDVQSAQKFVSNIKYGVPASVISAIALLRNDEQISTAIGSNIIKKAFIISYEESADYPESIEMSKYNNEMIEYLESTILPGTTIPLPSQPVKPFSYPSSDIYVIGNSLEINPSSGAKTLSNEMEHFNYAIESDLLESRLQVIHEMDPNIFAKGQFLCPYILDIDLDYFHTMDAINPTDADAFYDLIRNAEIITIATEPTFVDDWNQYDSTINSDDLLDHLKSHIKNALV